MGISSHAGYSDQSRNAKKMAPARILLKVENLATYFPVYKRGILKRIVGQVKAVDNISMDIYEGDIVRVRENDPPHELVTTEVKWDSHGFWPWTECSEFIDMGCVFSVAPDDIEAIGNVYESKGVID